MAGNVVYTVEAFESSPCQNGIFLRPSLWNGMEAGTSIHVAAAIPNNSFFPVKCPDGMGCSAAPPTSSFNGAGNIEMISNPSWTSIPLQQCVSCRLDYRATLSLTHIDIALAYSLWPDSLHICHTLLLIKIST